MQFDYLFIIYLIAVIDCFDIIIVSLHRLHIACLRTLLGCVRLAGLLGGFLMTKKRLQDRRSLLSLTPLEYRPLVKRWLGCNAFTRVKLYIESILHRHRHFAVPAS